MLFLMSYKPHHLYINGQVSDRRGLDLAVNPFTGRVVGEVQLIVDKAFADVDFLEDDFTDVSLLSATGEDEETPILKLDIKN